MGKRNQGMTMAARADNECKENKRLGDESTDYSNNTEL